MLPTFRDNSSCFVFHATLLRVVIDSVEEEQVYIVTFVLQFLFSSSTTDNCSGLPSRILVFG